jgi:(p)ppGpp synthase/HD superfamily hydrolase
MRCSLERRPDNPVSSAKAVQGPSLRETAAFVRNAHAGAAVGGQPRWLRSMAVMNLLPEVLPGIRVTLEERQVALLRDVLRTTAETEESLLRAGFPPAVVASVLRLTRFDAGFSYLEHLRVVAESKDLAAKRVAMAALLREEQQRAGDEAPEVRDRRLKAMAIMRRGLGY